MAWKLIISLISMINGDKCRFEHEFLNAWWHVTTLLRRFPFLDCLTFVFDDTQSTRHRIFIQKWEHSWNRSTLYWKWNCIHNCNIVSTERRESYSFLATKSPRLISRHGFSQKKFCLCGENVLSRFTLRKY